MLSGVEITSRDVCVSAQERGSRDCQRWLGWVRAKAWRSGKFWNDQKESICGRNDYCTPSSEQNSVISLGHNFSGTHRYAEGRTAFIT